MKANGAPRQTANTPPIMTARIGAIVGGDVLDASRWADEAWVDYLALDDLAATLLYIHKIEDSR